MLKVAIVGAGTMGRVHSHAYKNVEGAQVVAICDIREEKASQLAAAHQAKIYIDFDTMLENEEIDMIDLCIPTYMHKDFALKAISYDKHVFCEKPIALKLEDAKVMIEAAKEKEVKFTVGHVVRYFPSYANAVDTVKSGRIGTPKLIRTARTGAFPSWCWEDWYSNYELSGGVLLDLVIHDFDWIRCHFGDVERVYAKSLSAKGVDRQDHCLVTLRLKNGAIVHVEGSWAYPEGSIFGTTFEIIGTEGQIEFDSRDSSPIKKHLCHEAQGKVLLESPLFADEEPYRAEIQAFVDCILNNTKPMVSGEDALKALEISIAAIESSNTGKAVVIGGNQK